MAGQAGRAVGLEGAVGNEHFAQLTEGQHPTTEAQLVRHQVSKTSEGKVGKEVTSVEHRAGWDARFSAPKSVSLTALVGIRWSGARQLRLRIRQEVVDLKVLAEPSAINNAYQVLIEGFAREPF